MESSENKLMESEKLPADMMLEILSRASFETVERSKAVSKGLRRIILDPSFLPLHCKRTNNLFGYYFDSEFVSDADHSSGTATINLNLRLPRDMCVLASCNHGILFCVAKYYDRFPYYVCKPATQQWQTLPNSKYSYFFTDAFALIVIESHPLRYNIVRLSRSKLKYNFEIFDSQNWKWEQTQGPTLASNELIISFTVPISVGESVHYITSNDNVLEFNVKNRIFRCFPLPEAVCNNGGCKRKKLINYQGNLGFSCVTKDGNIMMDVWVAEGQRWTRKMRVDMKLLQNKLMMPELVEFCNTDVAFMKTAHGGVFCNFRDGSFSKIDVPYHIMKDVLYIFRFQSDFESVDLKGKRDDQVIRFPWIRRIFCL